MQMEKKNRRVTIKDVARSSGFSIGTVSRYLGNSGYVSSEAKNKIEDAIHELHYVPNAAARSMINQQSRIVGILVPEINNPFLADLVVRIESRLSKQNYSIMLCNTGYSISKAETFIDDLAMRNAEGLILVSTDISDAMVLEKIKRFMFGVSVGQKILNFDSINFNDYKAAYDITKHLIKLGHKTIGCVGFNVNATQTVDRLDGVMTAIRDSGLTINEKYMLGRDYTEDNKLNNGLGENGGYICAKQLLELKEPPSAIVAINDFYAIGAYEAAYEKGLEIGRDISITGFDDIAIAKFMTPALTTVHCDTNMMAELAVGLLLQKISESTLHESRHEEGKDFVLPAEIMIRQSTKSLKKY